MPNIKELYNHIERIEKIDKTEGAYPIYFNSDLNKVKFILYCRYRNYLKRIKKLCRR